MPIPIPDCILAIRTDHRRSPPSLSPISPSKQQTGQQSPRLSLFDVIAVRLMLPPLIAMSLCFSDGFHVVIFSSANRAAMAPICRLTYGSSCFVIISATLFARCATSASIVVMALANSTRICCFARKSPRNWQTSSASFSTGFGSKANRRSCTASSFVWRAVRRASASSKKRSAAASASANCLPIYSRNWPVLARN
jgi:hypothetical protein